MSVLILYTRQGCCLCEGLEERLRDLQPPLDLQLIDVDTDPALQARYGLSVPVLARSELHGGSRRIIELPPVPPRLHRDRLRVWLERHLSCYRQEPLPPLSP